MTPGAPVGVGFLGAGNVLPAYLQTLDRLVPTAAAVQGPVCARNARAGDALLARRPASRVVATVAEVLEDDGVDLVVVLTPPSTHASLVRRALEAGKHVLCEKPVSWSAAEAAGLFDQAGEGGRILLAAPFVHLSPTFRRLWTLVTDGAIGRVHTARAHYGNPGSTWAAWYHDEPLATLGDVASYNLKSLAALLGPVDEVYARTATARPRRVIRGNDVVVTTPDSWHLVLQHVGGAVSSVVASSATVRYRRPAIELYGDAGSANLIGDDWDPRGLEVWSEAEAAWRSHEPEDGTWLWTDGLREAVMSIRDGRAPLASPALDIHVLDVIEAAGESARAGRAMPVASGFAPFDALRRGDRETDHHVHDRTRPAADQ